MRRHKPEVYGLELPQPIGDVMAIAVNVSRFQLRRGQGSAQKVRDAEAVLQELNQTGKALIPGSVLSVVFPECDAEADYQAWAWEPYLVQVIE